ncbi:MAG TPA: pyrimidine 5'-nucleotidase [Candidatus Accumulibacter phosphatis]|nr:MAG: phosphoglycolate phosphatase [Candidatus Accumulibacter sp. SK-11]HAY28123.1 pyrimidine 5'-nucleotidase [Accumulibacter sp.]HRL74329.1 pyrimidine 5'-nucleotidase [Candidatus Accumulibacter phosphatis]HCN67489.1 pyrimidine 5'-nucleotidase [Accumulibacter sp.]HCV14433.1 pyrimidine 5'-nucleotidase [Accumulibacter sp.]
MWLFDLDNTLHDATPHIFPHINRSMATYIRHHLGVDDDEATRLRLDYWQRYGATLLGLMRHHGTDPQHFLRHTHDFPDLKQMLVFERGLNAMLRRLPGRKIVFSNAPLAYSEAVLELVGVRKRFSALYSVERLRFQPKPALGGFRHLLRSERLSPRRCIMVEDSLVNLETAKHLGMKTVWISDSTRQPQWLDLRLPSVLELPRQWQRLQLRLAPCRPLSPARRVFAGGFAGAP